MNPGPLTFLTWTSPPGTGWRYRVYRSTAPIAATLDLDAATLVASVGDSTWADRRLSVLRNQLFAFTIDSLAPTLTASQGPCVITPASSRVSWYAVPRRQDPHPPRSRASARARAGTISSGA